MRNKPTPIRGDKGQFAGSVGGPGSTAPTAAKNPPAAPPSAAAAPRNVRTQTVPDAPSTAWPQADELDKVAAVTTAISEGADTADGVAETLNVVPRQGSYYACAAESLGFAERDTNSHPARWRLTEFGEQFTTLKGTERETVLRAAAENHPAVQLYFEEGEVGVAAAAEQDGLSPETARRRAQTAAAWAGRVTKPDLALLDGEMVHAAKRAAEAGARIRAALQARQRPAPEVCGTCHMEKSVTGVCFC